jgi:hypothetical protein
MSEDRTQKTENHRTSNMEFRMMKFSFPSTFKKVGQPSAAAIRQSAPAFAKATAWQAETSPAFEDLIDDSRKVLNGY